MLYFFTPNNFTVGQTVYLRKINNAVRGISKEDIEAQCVETTVTKIGKKYVTVEFKNLQFTSTTIKSYGGGMIENTTCCINYLLFPNKQCIYEAIQRENDLTFLHSFKQWEKLSKPVVQKIKALIELDIAQYEQAKADAKENFNRFHQNK